MLRFVLLAFGRACVARGGAELARSRREAAPARHERDGKSTKLGTIAVEPNAFDHLGHALFGQAGVRAVLASFSTCTALFDAFG